MIARLLYWWWVPVAVALAAVVGWETDWGDALYTPIVVAAAPEAKPVAPQLLPEYKQSAGPEIYAEVVDRPLFSPTRRPAPPPPPPEPPKQSMQTGQYQLTGTIEVGTKLYAFLKEVKTGRGLRVAQGDVLQTGLKLAKIEPDRVTFTQYDQEEEVKMVVSKSRGPTPTAPPPGAPGAPGVVPPGIPGAPGGVPHPGGVPGFPPPPVRPAEQPQPGTPSSIRPGGVPGAATLAPFVPGVSPAPRSEGVPDTPRRRGSPQ
ncbi:MAG: hypothetical protein ABJB04_05910 [Betaproteobacteria bacterium]